MSSFLCRTIGFPRPTNGNRQCPTTTQLSQAKNMCCVCFSIVCQVANLFLIADPWNVGRHILTYCTSTSCVSELRGSPMRIQGLGMLGWPRSSKITYQPKQTAQRHSSVTPFWSRRHRQSPHQWRVSSPACFPVHGTGQHEAKSDLMSHGRHPKNVDSA